MDNLGMAILVFVYGGIILGIFLIAGYMVIKSLKIRFDKYKYYRKRKHLRVVRSNDSDSNLKTR